MIFIAHLFTWIGGFLIGYSLGTHISKNKSVGEKVLHIGIPYSEKGLDIGGDA